MDACPLNPLPPPKGVDWPAPMFMSPETSNTLIIKPGRICCGLPSFLLALPPPVRPQFLAQTSQEVAQEAPHE